MRLRFDGTSPAPPERGLHLAVGVMLCIAAACSSFTPAESEPTPDGGVPVEAGSDAGAAAEAGSFCSTLSPAPAFCVDCEDDQPLGFAFTQTQGPIAIVTAPVYAGLKAIQAKGAPGSYAYAARTLGKGFTKSLKFSYRVRMTPADGGAQKAIASRITLGGIVQCQFDIRLTETSASLATGLGTEHEVANYPGSGRWLGVSIELAVGGLGYVVAHVRLDGKESLVPEELVTGCPNTYISGLPRLEVGVQSVFVPFEIGFDDIALSGE